MWHVDSIYLNFFWLWQYLPSRYYFQDSLSLCLSKCLLWCVWAWFSFVYGSWRSLSLRMCKLMLKIKRFSVISSSSIFSILSLLLVFPCPTFHWSSVHFYLFFFLFFTLHSHYSLIHSPVNSSILLNSCKWIFQFGYLLFNFRVLIWLLKNFFIYDILSLWDIIIKSSFIALSWFPLVL